MPAGTQKRIFGPLALTNTLTTNVYNQASAAVYDIIKHIHVANKTAGPVTFNLYLGLTGANTAGTEVFFQKTVLANDVYDWYGNLRMDSTDFLVGGASASTSLTITGEGERFVV